MRTVYEHSLVSCRGFDCKDAEKWQVWLDYEKMLIKTELIKQIDEKIGVEQYAPGTSVGNKLLAHELTHVVQQDTLKGIIQRSDMTGTPCPRYLHSEVTTSRTQRGYLDPDVTLHGGGKLLIADFGVNRQNVKASTQSEPLLITWLNNFESDQSYRLRIIGCSDCHGSDSTNINLRHGRAEQVENLLRPGARSRVTFRGMAALDSYVTGNDTLENRAKNRGVIIEFRQEVSFPPDTITVPRPNFVCGMDIGSQASAVFTLIQSTFRSWSDWQRFRSCGALLGIGANPIMAWDIRELYLPNTGWLRRPPYRPACGIPPSPSPYEDPATCSNSVQVGNKCFLAGTVNYGTFGIMCKLCYDHMRGMFPLHPLSINPLLFSETAMRALIFAWKTVDRDDPVPPITWAVATYRGGPSGVSTVENRPRCTSRCPISYSGAPFDFVWEPIRPR